MRISAVEVKLLFEILLHLTREDYESFADIECLDRQFYSFHSCRILISSVN